MTNDLSREEFERMVGKEKPVLSPRAEKTAWVLGTCLALVGTVAALAGAVAGIVFLVRAVL